MNRREHWEKTYATKTDDELSWTQIDPAVSLKLIAELLPRGSVIDVGGGTSVLSERLLAAGYSPTVLDISETALARARKRSGEKAPHIRWIAADVTTTDGIGQFDLWHDRAVFHFLTDAEDRKKYVDLARRTVPVGGRLVIATFALNGPERCSGLAVERYDGRKVASEFADGFALKKVVADAHLTPRGQSQQFDFFVFDRV